MEPTELFSIMVGLENISGERNPMFGKKPTDETKLMVILAKDTRKYALMNFLFSSTPDTFKSKPYIRSTLVIAPSFSINSTGVTLR